MEAPFTPSVLADGSIPSFDASDCWVALVVCSLLSNNLGEQGANAIVEVAKDKPQLTTLCGFKPDQKEADLSGKKLGVGDAILLAFDLKTNSVLVELK